MEFSLVFLAIAVGVAAWIFQREISRVRRLLTGSFTKGRAGENLLAAALAAFPPELLKRDFRIGGKVCEFALQVTDHRVLPIDSKWPGADGTDTAARKKVREVAGYIDPHVTVPMAVMAVPDAVYERCRKAHVDAVESRVVIVSYSNAMSTLLSLYQLHRSLGGTPEDMHLQQVYSCLAAMQRELDGRLANGSKMLDNSRAELRFLVAKARDSLRSTEVRDDVA